MSDHSLRELRQIFNGLLMVPVDQDSKYYPLWKQLKVDVERDLKTKECLESTPARFPDDFHSQEHPYCKECTAYRFYDFTGDNTQVLVLGGGLGVKGDGVTTYELIDYRFDGGEPMEFVTAEEINRYLITKPLYV